MLHLTFALALAAPFQPMAGSPLRPRLSRLRAAALVPVRLRGGCEPPLPPDPVAMVLATRFAAAIKCDPGKRSCPSAVRGHPHRQGRDLDLPPGPRPMSA